MSITTRPVQPSGTNPGESAAPTRDGTPTRGPGLSLAHKVPRANLLAMSRLRELFTLRGTVGRSQYLATGLALAMVKYSVDAGSCLLLRRWVTINQKGTS